MRQVAEAAGIGKATIYHHFPDKQSIVMALLSHNLAHMDEAMQLVRAESDPRRRIQVAAEASVSFLFESADIMQIVRREIPGSRDSPRRRRPALLALPDRRAHSPPGPLGARRFCRIDGASQLAAHDPRRLGRGGFRVARRFRAAEPRARSGGRFWPMFSAVNW